jgi:hypothetical protein
MRVARGVSSDSGSLDDLLANASLPGVRVVGTWSPQSYRWPVAYDIPSSLVFLAFGIIQKEISVRLDLGHRVLDAVGSGATINYDNIKVVVGVFIDAANIPRERKVGVSFVA